MKKRCLMANTIESAGVSDEKTECPACGLMSVQTLVRTVQFPYGTGESTVTLEAEVPVSTCASCGFEFTDDEAERIKHEVVCRNLGVMTPTEILALRNQHGLSRAEFADLTKIGDASLARWERGSLVQNAANDQFMYLLKWSENALRLKSRKFAARLSQKKDSSELASRFRNVEDLEKIARDAECFQLRRRAV
jgi:putative zinc finger/helix-turn-helix YgiT family protein